MSSNPNKDAEAEFERRIKAIGMITGQLSNILNNAFNSCLNCDHFQPGPEDRSNETCGLNGRTPPPSIAARGCDNWTDKIPF